MATWLSIVLPAYNEAQRLPPYLRSIRSYLAGAAEGDYEVIVVDDGSRDRLDEALGGLLAEWPELRLLRNATNLGKGGAVRRGVLAARGDLVLFADADGATPIAEERKLRAEIQGGADLAVGSRLIRAPGAECSRCWYRGITGRLFVRLARAILPVSVQDTQCGFKMFRREVARRLFGPCRETGYLFDLYILAMAARLGYTPAEVAVSWADIPGSKVRIVRDSWKMLRGLWQVRRAVELDHAHDHGIPAPERAEVAVVERDSAGRTWVVCSEERLRHRRRVIDDASC